MVVKHCTRGGTENVEERKQDVPAASYPVYGHVCDGRMPEKFGSAVTNRRLYDW